jgi:hypothetical protein
MSKVWGQQLETLAVLLSADKVHLVFTPVSSSNSHSTVSVVITVLSSNTKKVKLSG